MKAALLFAKDDIRVQDIPRPEIGDGDILLRCEDDGEGTIVGGEEATCVP